MSKFVTKTMTQIKGDQVFKQLIIVDDDIDTVKLQAQIDELEKNGKEVAIKGQFDLYDDALEEKYKSARARIEANMNRVANLQSVPEEKFKDVTIASSKVTEYEYKYGDLRAWSMKIPYGQLFILGGFKNDQKKGFNKFRSLVDQYLESQKPKNEKK